MECNVKCFWNVCICYYENTSEYKKSFYYFVDDLLNINEEVLTKLANNNHEIPKDDYDWMHEYSDDEGWSITIEDDETPEWFSENDFYNYIDINTEDDYD